MQLQVVIKEMNRLGMIIDLANSSSNTQLKVLEVSKAPCIFTNVAAYALTANERNVKESLLDAIVKKFYFYNRNFFLQTSFGNFILEKE